MKNRLLLLTILLLPASAMALQVVDVADGKTIPVVVSQKELNRIAMSHGGRIDHIWGPQDRMVLETDTQGGQLFIRALGTTPFSLFVKGDNGETYTLLATPRDVPAETLFLRPPYRPASTLDAERSLPYIKRVERLAKALGQRALPDGYMPKQDAKTIPLWREVSFKREMVYRGDTLNGETYRLTNITGDELRLEEREFATLPGDPVAAVAIDTHLLKPQESTLVVVIRKAIGHE